jgi:glutamate-1-semialdehyde 2,1-aminomutase
MNSGQKLWERALKAIPGGNGLLSKRPDRYAPDIWPNYFEKGEGVNIWDLDGKKYIDMAQMGIGTAILGYAHKEVNQAVLKAVEKGVNATLNTPEEVWLAEKLIELNPYFTSVKFARTGGEAMAIAVRIARAYKGLDKIAFSGYHGWSDWYLATNLSNNKNLDGHLLSGLSPKGVPSGLVNTVFPFRYNDIDDMEMVLGKHSDIGIIIIEGARYDFPTQEFLDALRCLAQKREMIVISDEITSGWRMTDGGVYKINGFRPDIVVYGKAMGNGFAISAVIGKREIMDMAQETFISSTFWTERVGFAAALKTIDVLTREEVWKHLNRIGNKIGDGWNRLARKHGLKLHVSDFKPLITMKFEYADMNSALATLFTQEMLKRGYLAASSVYVSYGHSSEIVDEYLQAVDEVFKILGDAVESDGVFERLETRVREEGFKRLN